MSLEKQVLRPKRRSYKDVMNFIAGILIGIVNDSWVTIVIASFIWGIVWCFFQVVFTDKLKNYKAHFNKERAVGKKLKMNYVISFYLIEYFTATITALITSILIRIIINSF